MIQSLNRLSAPLVVSVTGHRDPKNPEILKSAFAVQLKELRAKEGLETKDCILLSALAEGADTLAAQVALELGWTVIAPLPLPRGEYRRDFEGDALQEFNRLLELCPHFFVGDAPGSDCENAGRYTEEKCRNRQYAYVGEFLTRQCEVLIAFWDGIAGDPDKPGGTDDVVKMQQEGIPIHLLEMRPNGTLLDAPEGGRVIQIWTERRRHKEHGQTIGSKRHGQVENLEIKTKGQTLQHRDTRREDWQQFVADVTRGETPEDMQKAVLLDPEQPDPYLSLVRDSYLRADASAQQLQGEVEVWFKRILGVAIVFTLCVAGANAFGDQAWSVVPLIASWALLFLSWRFTQKENEGKRANRRQDYRALAEAWRVCFFWRAIGISDPLDASYLSQHRGELDWIRHALRTSDLQWRAATSRLPQRPENAYPVPTAWAFEQAFKWVEGQSEYFNKRKVPKDRQRLTTLRNWSWALLLFGSCASAVATLAQLKSTPFADSNFGTNLWHFVATFVSADLLSSPFVPAALLLARMGSWPLVTEQNIKDQNAPTQAERDTKRRLRFWFERQSKLWRLVAVISALLMCFVVSAIYLEILPDEQVIPFLKLIATLCFFLPALIFVEADFHALPEHVGRYERMFSVFERAKQMLEQIAKRQCSDCDETIFDWSDPNVQNRARRIYRELGCEALRENGEWLSIHRERPLDIEA